MTPLLAFALTFAALPMACGDDSASIKSPDAIRSERTNTEMRNAEEAPAEEINVPQPQEADATNGSETIPTTAADQSEKEPLGDDSLAQRSDEPIPQLQGCPDDAPKIARDNAQQPLDPALVRDVARLRLSPQNTVPATFTIDEARYPKLTKFCINVEGSQQVVTLNITKPLAEAVIGVYGFANRLTVNLIEAGKVQQSDITAVGSGNQVVNINVSRFNDCAAIRIILQEGSTVRCQTQ